MAAAAAIAGRSHAAQLQTTLAQPHCSHQSKRPPQRAGNPISMR